MTIALDSLTEHEEAFIQQLEFDKNWALDYYSIRDQDFDRSERWYFKEHYLPDAELDPGLGAAMEIGTDENEHLVVLPIPTNIINSVHGVLTDEDFYIRCLSNSGAKSEERASNTERFLHGTYWINRQTQGDDPWETSELDALVYGWGVVYSYWDTDRAEMSRDKRGRPKDVMDFYSFPIVVKRIHPKDIRPILGGVREKYKGIVYNVMRTRLEVEEEWGCEIEPHPMYDDNGGFLQYEDLADDTLIEYIDYWIWRRDKEPEESGKPREWQLWHCVMAHNQVVKRPTAMPEYEFLPYEIFFCRRSPSDSGSKMGMSFLYTIIEPVQELEYLINRTSRMVEMYSDPMTVVVGAADGQDMDIEKGPGTTFFVEAGGDVKYVTWAGNPPDVQQLIRLWKDAAQDAYPPVMSGLAGGTSGLDTIALQQGGKLQTNKPRRNLELAIQRVNAKILRLFQRFSPNDPLFIMGQRTESDEDTSFAFSLKGKETKGYENTIVTVRGRMPQEELQNVALAASAINSGMIPARDASSKYMYVQDPDRAYRRWLEEKAAMDPAWRQFFQQLYFQLPPRSPVGEALATEPPIEESGPEDFAGSIGAEDAGGGQIAAALASTGSEVQQGVQRTAVPSNVMSAFMGEMGGAPPNGPL